MIRTTRTARNLRANGSPLTNKRRGTKLAKKAKLLGKGSKRRSVNTTVETVRIETSGCPEEFFFRAFLITRKPLLAERLLLPFCPSPVKIVYPATLALLRNIFHWTNFRHFCFNPSKSKNAALDFIGKISHEQILEKGL
jgi:hypothetical protein